MADYTPSPESFAKLLDWLGSDRDQSAVRYEGIRRKLVKFFMCRGCSEPEDLTDITIDRVTRTLGHPSFSYVGDPLLYFYGVAKNVRLEYFRRQSRVPMDQPRHPSSEDDRRHECLERCLERVTDATRKLLLEYYDFEAGGKTSRRQLLAQSLGIPLNALRIRLHRMRNQLRECVVICLKEGSGT